MSLDHTLYAEIELAACAAVDLEVEGTALTTRKEFLDSKEWECIAAEMGLKHANIAR